MKKFILIIIMLISVVNFSHALTEEEIFNETDKHLSLYSFSNNASEIETVIKTRTGITVKLSDVGWELSSRISSNIKDTMNRLNLNYSMTTYLSPYMQAGFVRVIYLYRRVGDQWFIYQQTVIDQSLIELLKNLKN